MPKPKNTVNQNTIRELTKIMEEVASGRLEQKQAQRALAAYADTPELDLLLERFGETVGDDLFDLGVFTDNLKMNIRPVQPGERNIDEGETVTVCEVCGILLNRLTLDSEVSWQHGRSYERYDHEPVPKVIPRAEHGGQDCDFCGHNTRTAWVFEGDRATLETPGKVLDYGTKWGACTDCSEDIHNGDLESMLNRMARHSHMIKQYPDVVTQEMRARTLDTWTSFLATVHSEKYVGPQREPVRLNPRMMPKLQQGLIRFWNDPQLRATMSHSTVAPSLPGVHCGDEEQFRVRFPEAQALPEAPWSNHVKHLIAGIYASDLYWISEKFTQLSIMAGKDFESTLAFSREDLPSTFGFMLYAQPIMEVQRPHGRAGIRAITWTLVPGGIWINLYFQGEDGDPKIDVEQMRAQSGYLLSLNSGSGITFNHDFEVPDDPQFDVVKTIFATWFLMNQPGVAEQSAAPVDKKYARSFQRANGRKLPAVQLVDLRKQPRRTAPADDAGTGRKLAYRVYRKGHWKMQAYGPQRGMRKQIYVSQYIAGPDDAPLKTKPTTVKVLR